MNVHGILAATLGTGDCHFDLSRTVRGHLKVVLRRFAKPLHAAAAIVEIAFFTRQWIYNLFRNRQRLQANGTILWRFRRCCFWWRHTILSLLTIIKVVRTDVMIQMMRVPSVFVGGWRLYNAQVCLFQKSSNTFFVVAVVLPQIVLAARQYSSYRYQWNDARCVPARRVEWMNQPIDHRSIDGDRVIII